MRKMSVVERKAEIKRGATVGKSQLASRPEEPLKFYIGNGNNSQLVRRIVKLRSNWVEVENSKELFINFRWQQTSKNYKYQNCIQNRVFKQSLNHYQYHQELSNKQYLFKNLFDYCQNHKMNAFDFIPITFILNFALPTFEQDQLFFRKFYNENNPQQSAHVEELRLRRRRMNPNNLFSLTPKNAGVHCKYQIHEGFKIENSPFLWILKPTFYNRGSGIHVFTGLTEMEELMSRYIHGVQVGGVSTPVKNSPEIKKAFRIRQLRQAGSHNTIRSNSFVIQKYMQRPMLVAGRKFDIRMWVLVTHQLKVYIFRQGYLRTSSYQYSLTTDKLTDPNVHLTNNAVQKHNDDYGRYESGNQLSFDYLRELLKDKKICYDDLIGKVREIVKMSMLSVRKKINKQDRSYCFQVFGYDFMLDHMGKPWLIEVNTNPCIQESSPILQELLPRMLDDAFALTLDQIFEIKTSYSHFAVSKKEDKENLWDFIVDLKKL